MGHITTALVGHCISMLWLEQFIGAAETQHLIVCESQSEIQPSYMICKAFDSIIACGKSAAKIYGFIWACSELRRMCLLKGLKLIRLANCKVDKFGITVCRVWSALLWWCSVKQGVTLNAFICKALVATSELPKQTHMTTLWFAYRSA